MNILKKQYYKRVFGLWLIVLAATAFGLILCLNSCNGKAQQNFQGSTMGTTWHVKIVGPKNNMPDITFQNIQLALDTVSNTMSLFNPASELSQINQTKANTPVPVSPALMTILAQAENLYTLTDGKWDCTVAPLTNLWGFGTYQQRTTLPDASDLTALLQITGFHHINIDYQNKTLTKTRSATAIDLGSIAKGYGVDVIARLLHNKGCQNFIVEVGGELYAAGHRIDGSQWKVGINQPEKNAPRNALTTTIRVSDTAVATSGDYRNFYTVGDRTFSHIIDPTTGWPVDNTVAGVTVTASNATLADGLATAVMVLGIEKGLELINTMDKTEALIIARKRASLHHYKSNGWAY